MFLLFLLLPFKCNFDFTFSVAQRFDRIGIFSIRTPENLEGVKFVQVLLTTDKNLMLNIWAMDAHFFSFNHSIPYLNVLRKWSRICISYDFDENQAQVSFHKIKT